MEWIKLIDRKPTKSGLIYCRNIKGRRDLFNPACGLPYPEWVEEWLDESTPSSSKGFTEEEMKDCATKFFYHWFNTLGSNTMEGFKDWFPGYLASLPSKVEGEQWVSYEDRMPPAKESDCLVLFDNGEVRRFLEDHLQFAKMTHWMLLPKPLPAPSKL